MTDDLHLIKRLRSADREAVVDFYDRYGKLLYGVIHRACGDGKEAEKLLVATFEYVLRRLNDYDSSAQSFASWLLWVTRSITATNTSFADFTTTDSRRGEVTSSTAMANPKHNGVAHSEQPKQQSVIDLFLFGNGTLQQVSEHLGLTENEVRILLRESVKQFRPKLENVL